MIILLLLLLFPLRASAYLDPGTGSYILQAILAALLGGLFTLKMFWKNIKVFIIRVFSRNKKS